MNCLHLEAGQIATITTGTVEHENTTGTAGRSAGATLARPLVSLESRLSSR